MGIDRYTATATVKLELAFDGGDKPGAGSTAMLYVNRKSVESAKIGTTEFAVFSGNESASVGVPPVSEDKVRAISRFTVRSTQVLANGTAYGYCGL